MKLNDDSKGIMTFATGSGFSSDKILPWTQDFPDSKQGSVSSKLPRKTAGKYRK
jgi:hypothetical protein